MRFGRNEKLVLEMLERDGEVKNLGKTYKGFAKAKASNIALLNFFKKVKGLYPDATLEPGKRNDLDTATLKIE